MNYWEFKKKVGNMPFLGSDLAGMLAMSPRSLRNQFSRWKKRGWLLELKRGLYMLPDGERRITLSREAIAAVLYQPSYISLETALSLYEMIPERVSAVTSVSPKKTRVFHNAAGTFIYRNLKLPLHFGFIPAKDENGHPYFIAEPEKALLDYLYLNLGRLDPKAGDLLHGFLRLQNLDRIGRKKLLSYARRFSVKKMNAILEELP